METPGTVVPGVGQDSDAVGQFLAMLDENLVGRRVLARAGQASEAEPATLAQLEPMRRVQDALGRLRARSDEAAGTAAQAAELAVKALVAELATRADRRVADWPGAAQVLDALAHFLDTFDAAVPAPRTE